MRRAVILVTLTFLLLAAAGVTAAREDTFDPISQDPGQPESTIPESTGLEETVEETTVEPEEPEELTREEPIQEGTTPAEENPDDIREDDENEEAGRPGKPDKPEKPAKGDRRGGKDRAVGKPDDAGKAREKRSGGNQGKVTLCHKDKVTISVGAPAEPAHLRHGDSRGAC